MRLLEFFPSGFAFSGVLLCCVLSVVMKIDYHCYKLDTHNCVPLVFCHYIISIYMQINGLPDDSNQQQ